MPDEEALTADHQLDRLAVNGNTQLFWEVVKHPHVVVAGEECDRDAGIAQLGKFSLKADETSGNCMAVLEPEIEDVTKEVNGLCIVTNRFKPGYDFALAFKADFRGRDTQVEVGGEVEFLASG